MNFALLEGIPFRGLLFSQSDGAIVKVSPDILDKADRDKIDRGTLTERITLSKPLAERRSPAAHTFCFLLFWLS